MSRPLLEVRDLATWVESADQVVRAVDSVSFTITRGETFALLGESGCGKSTVALSIARLLPEAGRVVSGSVKLDEVDLLRLPENRMRAVRGRRIGMIFQEPGASLDPVLPVGVQVAEVLERHTPLRGNLLDQRVLELLDAVGIPDPRRRRHDYPFQLSGGMKQRIMIAIALACEPDLLIADEPTSALDVTIQAQVLDLLRGLQQRLGMSMLLITHDLGVVAETAHRVAVMYAGEIVEEAPRERFFRDPRHPYSRKLFASIPGPQARKGRLAAIRGAVPALTRPFAGCRFAERCDRAWALCRAEAPGWTDLGAGGGVRCHLYSAPGARASAAPGEAAPAVAVAAREEQGRGEASIGRPLLEVTGLKVHFPVRKGLLRRTVGWLRAVDGVSFAIPGGRTLALVGESGCGKTTVGKGVLRLLPIQGGSVRFEGKDLAALSGGALRARRRDFQIIFQDPYSSLNPRMRVLEIIREGMRALRAVAEEEQMARIDELLAQVGLTPDMKFRYPHQFSGGQRQRIAIARALAVKPRLIVCDEPTSALDLSVQAQILNLLKELQDRLGIAYLFITHNVSVVQFLAHEVAVMYLGRIVEHGTVEEVLGDAKHPYTRALLSAVPAISASDRPERIRLPGDLPSPLQPPTGCHFHPRCPLAMDACRRNYPEPVALSATRTVHCHLYR
ncbi:MAG TPA: ABC transporter ATP-binding protein [Burkholderiales bacterium]|jgi:peptide/nickel transport system ATP-binding protein|nr:ABC transporter ATP-binding protein [Burkholderiales bacterium]